MSHVTHLNESCHTSEWVMSLIWRSHVTHPWVMSHFWMSHVTHLKESCHASERVISPIEMRHNTLLNQACRSSDWVMHGICKGVEKNYPNALQYTATHCNTLHHTATHYRYPGLSRRSTASARALITIDLAYCNALHNCNTLQHTATHYRCSGPSHRSTALARILIKNWLNMLQHTATHCNTLQHTAGVQGLHIARRHWQGPRQGLWPHKAHRTLPAEPLHH